VVLLHGLFVALQLFVELLSPSRAGPSLVTLLHKGKPTMLVAPTAFAFEKLKWAVVYRTGGMQTG
jgi:hypothetical protein